MAKPGETLLLTLYWQAQRDIPEDLTVFVQLLDPDRNLVAQNDGLTDNGFLPTTLWSADRIVPDQRNLDLPRDLQPGIYHLVAGLYRFDDLARLPVFTPAGQSPDDQIEVGTIKIPMETSATAEHVLGASLGTSIRLIGFDLASVDARGGIARKADSSVPSRLAMTAGQTIALTLQWQALARMDSDYKVFVHVVDEQGNLVAQQDQIPAHDRYPTRIWDEGERVADSYHLPELPPGRYEVIVGMYSADTGERLIALDEKGQALADRQIIIAQIEIAGQ